DRLLQAVVEQRAVREPRQRIVVGLLLDPLLVEPPLGHVFDRAFVVAHAALGIEDGARVLADPDDVAVLAIHLRLEAGDLASRRDDPHELLAPAGIDVKLMTDILERRDQLVRRIEAVDPREGRVRIEIAAFRSRAKDAFDRVVEEASIASLGFQQIGRASVGKEWRSRWTSERYSKKEETGAVA